MICLTCIVMMEYTNSRILPQTSEMSSLGKVFLTITTVSSLSILETCYVLALYHRPLGMLKWMPKRLLRLIVKEEDIKTSSVGKRPGQEGRYRLKSSFHHEQSTSPPTKLQQVTNSSPLLEKAKLIFEEIKNYNKKTNNVDDSKLFEKNVKEVAKFLDNIFILAAVLSVTVAFLTEILW